MVPTSPQQLLPTHNQPQRGSQTVTSFASLSQGAQGSVVLSRLSNPANTSHPPARLGLSISNNPNPLAAGEFVYWCIGDDDSDTRAVEICTRLMTDQIFLDALLRHFRKVFGSLKSWLMMTECAGATFSKVSINSTTYKT